MMRTAALVCALSGLCFGETPTILEIDIDNLVGYWYDSPNVPKFGTIQDPTPPMTGSSFTQILYLGDVVAINGRPAKGVYVGRATQLSLRPAPSAGLPISDVTRGGLWENIWELRQADGSPIGTIMCLGLGNGDPVPGAPTGRRRLASPSSAARAHSQECGGYRTFLREPWQRGGFALHPSWKTRRDELPSEVEGCSASHLRCIR